MGVRDLGALGPAKELSDDTDFGKDQDDDYPDLRPGLKEGLKTWFDSCKKFDNFPEGVKNFFEKEDQHYKQKREPADEETKNGLAEHLKEGSPNNERKETKSGLAEHLKEGSPNNKIKETKNDLAEHMKEGSPNKRKETKNDLAEHMKEGNSNERKVNHKPSASLPGYHRATQGK